MDNASDIHADMLATNGKNSAVKQRWQKDIIGVTKAIPEQWLIIVEDGTQWIAPEHANEPKVKMLQELMRVGYVYGWMPS